MLRNYSAAVLLTASALMAPLRAADCSLISTPSPMLAGGLAEPLGDLVLPCTSGVPGSVLQGTLLLRVDEKLSNQIDDQNGVVGLTVSVNVGGVLSPISAAVSSTQDSQYVVISGVSANFDSSGAVILQIGGLRAATAAKVQAQLGFSGTPFLSIPPQAVVVGYSVDSFLATTPDTLLQPNSGGLSGLDLSSVIAKMDPNLTARVTESDMAAFHAKLGIDNTGTRIAVLVPGLPDGSRVFAPDAIVGSDTDMPTTSGWFGAGPDPGRYVLFDHPVGSLLLVRVRGVGSDGSGGQLAWQPVAGTNLLGEVAISEADYQSDGSPFFVYEVADANPNVQESAQFPLYAFAGPTPSNGLIVVRAALQLMPVPAAGTQAASLPTPRYSASDIVAPDCGLLGDCMANWFPELSVHANSPTTRFLALNSGPVQGFLELTNTGGGVALWSASVDYGRRPGGWLRLLSTSGYVANQVNLTYAFSPFSLRPGTYQANIVFTLTNAPDGSKPSVSQAVELVIKPQPPIDR